MVMRDSFRRLILPGFFWIGVNGRRRFACRSVTTLRVSFQFMAQIALKPYLILDDDNSLDGLMSDRG